jgi:hypothetical protein
MIEMEDNVRRLYAAPAIEIIPVESGSVMAIITSSGTSGVPGSSGTPGTVPSGDIFSRSPYGGAGTSDLDAMINDILTVEQ